MEMKNSAVYGNNYDYNLLCHADSNETEDSKK